MIVRVYPSGILKDKGEDKEEYVVSAREIFIHTEKVILDGEILKLGENDELMLEVDTLHIVDEHFDSERDILTCKEVRLNTKGFSIKEAVKEVLQDIFEDTVIRTTHVE